MFPGGVRRRHGWTAILAVAVLGLGTAACGGGKGEAKSPGNVAGLPVTHFESGFKPNAPKPDLQVDDLTNEESDQIAAASIADVMSYWDEQLPKNFDGQKFEPVKSLLSYDSSGENRETACGDTKELVNAFYCGRDDSVAWDRGVLLPMLLKRFGKMSVVTVLAHEFGHAVQYRLLDKAGISANTPSIVKEQQADCFAGGYFRYLAEDKSKYFKLSTSEGLNEVMASLFFIRDQAGDSAVEKGAHGSAFDRSYAFQIGFEKTPKDCATINLEEIQSRITEVPFAKGKDQQQQGDSKIDEKNIGFVKESLDQAFSGAGAQPPQFAADGAACPSGPNTPPASYCPDNNTVTYDLAALRQLGQPADRQAEQQGEDPGGLGDFAVFAELASRYAQGIQKHVGASLDNVNAGLRTACLVGAWAAVTNKPGNKLRLSPGDLDEAIADLLLPNSLVSADVNGKRVESGFARVAALRKGYVEGSKTCTDQYG
ncbi:neutral zinc metallopeptidase [Amycolatopsis anabasis]|uniref:neutral zinc metallopeptidase n=1 Tax=Amycolatopsis anabasis TaxID=1840409 RepID=UPI00131C052C|nr:neutral zinc metallopeptidase [Amycolatopsis anabasis]